MFDLIIKNAKVVDGTGSPWFYADAAVTGSVISEVSHRIDADAKAVIDAKGLVLSPGFVDAHSHSDVRLLSEPELQYCVRQGITTVLMGQDGLSVAPIDDINLPLMKKRISGLLGSFNDEWKWRSMKDYLDTVAAAGVSVNCAMCIPHSNVRAIAHGWEASPCTDAELELMKKIVSDCMDEGAVAFSTGLIYPPGMYADRREFVELLRIVGEKGGFFLVHMRSEGKQLLESIDEVAGYCRESGCPLHLSHLKVFGKNNWGKSKAALEKIDELRASGMEVTFDQYPYTAGSTMIDACIPPWFHAGGTVKMLERIAKPEIRQEIREAMADPASPWENSFTWDDIIVSTASSSNNNTWMEGLSISHISGKLKKDPVDVLCDLLIEEQDAVTMIRIYGCEDDVERIIKHPAMCACTDGIMGGKPHPRVYGAFPRILGEYVRKRSILSLEEAVRKMSGGTARRMGLYDRGIIRPGMKADLVLFDAEKVGDVGTYDDPHRYPAGIEYVFVNGLAAVERGEYNGGRFGQVIRGKKF